MTMLRMACAFLIAVLCCSAAQEERPIATTNPGLIEGPWEITSSSEIGGIFLNTNRGLTSIRIYHRSGGKELRDNFAPDDKPAESDAAEASRSFNRFDGMHLRIHFVETTDLKPFDLDITFSASSNEWSGTWSRSGQILNVVLKRPEPDPGVVPNRFVGDWGSELSKPYQGPGSLHIRQSSDGMLSAWLDRTISPDDKRTGELLIVNAAAASKIVLERPGNAGPSSQYTGTLSDDGHALTGNGTQGRGGKLNAPDKFWRVPN
jgi:hypothetical protein